RRRAIPFRSSRGRCRRKTAMQNAKCKMQRMRIAILHFAFCILHLSSRPAMADGMIVVPSSSPAPFPLSVKYHRVRVDIRDAVAHTTVDQEFFNPTGRRLEGVYIFPLPSGAVVSDFAMEIDGKVTRAELLDATKARGIYEDIVRRMRDP